MRHAQEAEVIPLPVQWKPWGRRTSVLSFGVPPGAVAARFGPPVVDDPDGNGFGHESAWALRFPCGFECVLNLYRELPDPRSDKQTEALDVLIPVPEIEHVIRHLNAPVEWNPWRCDMSALDPEEQSQLSSQRDSWEVWRQDDNGNAFLMQYAASERDAKCVADTFERRAHKQIYWIKPRATP